MRTDVEDVEAGAARAVTERLRDVRLADAGAPDEQYVLVPLDERAGREVDDLGLGHLRVEQEVEVLDRAHTLEARAAEAAIVEAPKKGGGGAGGMPGGGMGGMGDMDF